MIETKEWIKNNIKHLFDYALRYIHDTNIIPTPKFHMVDKEGKMAIISCDFWADEDDETKDYDELGRVLENLSKAYGAVASLLVVAGKFNGEDVIAIITFGEPIPTIHIKKMIWAADIVDFGPVQRMPYGQVKNFKF